MPDPEDLMMRATATLLTTLLLAAPATASSPPDSTYTMPGGEGGRVFESLTIEGEDKVEIRFERPDLQVDLDARAVPGLERDDSRKILERGGLDLEVPLLAASARGHSDRRGRPWCMTLRQGSVARFQPGVKGVERWELTVADASGDTVRTFAGKGRPPEEIAWNGLTRNGGPALPGRTYSYVFTAWDEAGNRRNFVGEGFDVPDYRYRDGQRHRMVFSGASTRPTDARVPAAVLLEVVSWLNQETDLAQVITVRVMAPGATEAETLAQRVESTLQERLCGDPLRLKVEVLPRSDAPREGVVIVETGR
jgi:hypothetical protein